MSTTIGEQKYNSIGTWENILGTTHGKTSCNSRVFSYLNITSAIKSFSFSVHLELRVFVRTFQTSVQPNLL